MGIETCDNLILSNVAVNEKSVPQLLLDAYPKCDRIHIVRRRSIEIFWTYTKDHVLRKIA